MERFQGTRMLSDDRVLKLIMLVDFLGYLNVVQGIVLKMYFAGCNILGFLNENVFSLPMFLVMYVLKIFLLF